MPASRAPERHANTLALLAGVALLGGCAASFERFDGYAAESGYRKIEIAGLALPLASYQRDGRATDHRPGSALHVYLEGDGTPWLRRGLAATDPTPQAPLVIDLMRSDPAPSILLGRPCHHGVRDSRRCTENLWTTGRYSETVVANMAAAIDRLSEQHPSVVLIGYSGGGTLAMLLAERVPKATAVVTVAANLDTDRWARLHGEQLDASLNPATRPPLPVRIRQVHLAGGKDDNVPPEVVRAGLETQALARMEVFEAFDHRCCWAGAWPDILARLQREITGAPLH